MPVLSRTQRIALISTTIGTGVIVGMSYLRNFCLRLLLSYQHWLYESSPPSKTTVIWGVRTDLAFCDDNVLFSFSNGHLFRNSLILFF